VAVKKSEPLNDWEERQRLPLPSFCPEWGFTAFEVPSPRHPQANPRKFYLKVAMSCTTYERILQKMLFRSKIYN
jgi:hypothetical protein